MFSLVIAPKQLLNDIKTNRKLLDTFIDKKNVAFCEWHPEKKEFEAVVPGLVEKVKKKEQWRAIIICNEDNIDRDNPYDYVKYHEQLSKAGSRDNTHEMKMAMFDTAVTNPLVKLAARLCDKPVMTMEYNSETDSEMMDYQSEMKKKIELWNSIVVHDEVSIQLPSEIICIARRCYDTTQRKVNGFWNSPDEKNYSEFHDYNMYFDNMRYLVFDMPDKKHVDYSFCYIKFLMTILTVAGNDTPRGCLSPRRVYRLNCVDNRRALQNTVSIYDKKLSNTEEMLEEMVKRMESIPAEYLSDDAVNSLFDERIEVISDHNYSVGREKCFVNEGIPGITTDMPRKEMSLWKQAYNNSFEGLRTILKSARRMLKRATANVACKNVADENCEKLLEDFQQEDIIEYSLRQEKSIMENQPDSIYDIEYQKEKMKEQGEVINKMIDKRLKFISTIVLCMVILLISLFGVTPYVIDCIKSSSFSSSSLLLTGAIVVGTVVTLIVILLILRHRLVKELKNYNEIMKDFADYVVESNIEYSSYLSAICNLMRAYSVIDRDKNNIAASYNKIQLLKKHIADIHCEREILLESLGQFIINGQIDEPENNCYDYDFSKFKRYSYPMIDEKLTLSKVTYMQDGNYAMVSGGFIDRIEVEREELYD